MGDTHELKPCPFCDGAPRIVEPHQSDRSIEGETDDEEWLSFIECDCVDMFFVKGSATSQDEARQSVVTAWNRRPALSAGQAQPGSIKPLEWTSETPYHVARVFGGHYSIERVDSRVTYFELKGSFVWPSKKFATINEAKAAAQQDYETRIRSALSVPLPEIEGGDKGDGWQPIETAPKDKTHVIIAVPTKDKDDFIVGEAYFDPEHYGDDGDWWWAGTNYGDYHSGPISEVNYHGPSLWQHLPAAPSASIEGETP